MAADALAALVKSARELDPTCLGWHEAGHAVIGSMLGSVRRVWIDPGRAQGECRVSAGDDATVWLCLRVAGELAEALRPAASTRLGELAGVGPAGSCDDRDAVIGYARDLVGPDLHAQADIIAHAKAEVGRILRAHRGELAELAAALLDRRSLTGADVESILHRR
jgi:hypothetical protein